MATDDTFGLPPGFVLDEGMPAIGQVPSVPAFDAPAAAEPPMPRAPKVGAFAMPEPYIEAIKGFEGFAPSSKWDYKQNSVGYGTRGAPGETITPEVADARLRDELAKAARIVDDVAPDAPEGVKAALTSLTFNAGNRWVSSGLGDAVRKGDYDRAREQFLRYTRAGGQELPGLVNRRMAESAWFGGGNAPDTLAGGQGADTLGLPPGFQVDKPAQSAPSVPGLPPGFQVDAPTKADEPEGFFSGMWKALSTGTKQTGSSIKAAAGTYAGSSSTVEDAARYSNEIKKDDPAALTKFQYRVEKKKAEFGDTVWGGIKNVASAAWENPRGVAEFVVQQAPNSAAVLAPAFTGAAIGSMAGPFGSTVGFLVGLFGGNTVLETGGKAQEKAGDGKFTDAERAETIKEGAVKGGVITGIDAATLGTSRWLMGTTSRAVEKATAKVLADNGIDAASAVATVASAQARAVAASAALPKDQAVKAVTDATVDAMRQAGLANDAIVLAVKEAQENAVKLSNSVAKRAGRLGSAVALETVGEGLGEYLGELAATGQSKPTDAVMEAIAGLTMSVTEVSAAKKMAADNPGTLTKAFGAPINTPPGVTQPAPAPAPLAEQGTPVPAPTVSNIPAEQQDVLRQMGWKPDDIADMTPEQVATERADAASQGIVPKAAAALAPDAPTAEPMVDLLAQIEDMKDPANPRKGVYLSPDNLDNLQSQPEFVNQIASALSTPGSLVPNVDGKGGMLLAQDKTAADEVRAAIKSGADPQSILGSVTGAGNGKPADGSVVVQQKTPTGAVTRETLTTPEGVEAAKAELAAPGRTVEAIPAADAVKRREDGIAAEAGTSATPTPTIGDGTRKAPVKVATADDVAVAGQRVSEPTEAQKDAGNYQKAHVNIQGLDITIENPKGSVRRGKDASGKSWEVTMPADYGYLKRSVGRDGDQVDVFIGGTPTSDRVWVIDQVNAETRKFDEHKSMLGFTDRDAAIAAYEAAFSDGKGRARIGGVTEMPLQQFRAWARDGKKTKPLGNLTGQTTGQEAEQAVDAPKKQPAKKPAKSPATALAVIRNLGGIRPDADLRQIADRARIPGLFNKNGMTPDDMLRALEERNFIQDKSGDYAPVDTSLQDLYDLVQRIVDGERVGEFGVEVEKPRSNKSYELERLDNVERESADVFTELGLRDDLTDAERKRLLDLVANDYMDVVDALERIAIESIENEAAADDRAGSVEEGEGNGQPVQEPGAQDVPGEQSEAPGRAPEPEEAPSQAPTAEVAQAPETGPFDSGPVPTFADVKALLPAKTYATDIGEYWANKNFPRGWVKLSDAQRRETYADIKKMYGGEAKVETTPAQDAKPKPGKLGTTLADLTKSDQGNKAAVDRVSGEAGETPVDRSERLANLEKARGPATLSPVERGRQLLAETPADAVPAPKAETQPETEKPATAKDEAGETVSPQDRLVARLLDSENPLKDIRDTRKFAREIGLVPEDATNKQIEEAVEAGIVAAARVIVAENSKSGPEWVYKNLVSLYERQPNLAARTGTSVANQAYSTPVPLAYLAGRLADVRNAAEVYEPTAGNGALLIDVINPSKVYANEIDPDRAAALKAQGFNVTSKDGAEVPSLTDIDSVIMNPPFGAVKDGGVSTVFTVGDLTTTKIDHAVVLNALEAMSDDGKAVLIIGGKRDEDADSRRASYRGMNMKDAKTGKGKDNFYRVLYDRYNVTDHFTVSGKLYSKQGASFPIDVIVVSGRGKSERLLPGQKKKIDGVDVDGLPALITSWDQLSEKIPNDTENDRTGDRPARTPVEPVEKPASIDAVGVEPDGGVVSKPGSAGARPKSESVRTGADRGQPGNGGSSSIAQDADATGVRGDAGRTDRDAPAQRERQRVKVDTSKPQVSYQPTSNNKPVDTLIPTNQAAAVEGALAAVQSEHGAIDVYVAEKLGYKPGSNEFGDAFSGEQVDTLALAIANVERGSALIVGSQTGIGKGRVAAGMLRYAIKNGMTPVFITEKPDLYGDMFRDMRDIGLPDMLGRDVRIFATNAATSVPMDEEAVDWVADKETSDEAGEKAPKRVGRFLPSEDLSKKNDAMRRILAGEDVADVIFTTYAQMQPTGDDKPTPFRHTFLSSIAPNAMIIMDESHNASGSDVKEEGSFMAKAKKKGGPTRAEFARDLAGAAKGVMFSSATWAKRPDSMILYARAMPGAVEDINKLPGLIKKGGVPLQQIISQDLAKQNYIRHERSFEGITYAVKPVDISEEAYGQFVTSVKQIFKFDLAVAKVRKDAADAVLAEIGAGSQGTDGGVGETSASATGFSSIMHNIVSQMLLAIKAGPAAQEAIAAHKRGEKPIITLANTNESFIRDFANDEGISIGDAVDMNFGHMLKRYLSRTLRITIKKPGEKKPTYVQIPVNRLSPGLQQMYRAVEHMIEQGNYEAIPLSPIDRIRHELKKAGMSVREITGRTTMLEYADGRAPKYVIRPKKELGAGGKRVTVKQFNSRELDAIIFNKSGSTGVSMHAKFDFKDRRKRHMIVVQADSEINTHLQTLGRAHRTGQVVLPTFTHIAANIPAEKRPLAILMGKMASLNANTTGATGSAFTVEGADFLNEVGDSVMAGYLSDHWPINKALGEPYKVPENGTPNTVDLAKKATGKLVLLDIPEQEAFLSGVQDAYKQRIEELNALGENPLEAKSLDLQARVLETTELVAKVGEGPFGAPVIIEKISAKSQGRAFDPKEIAERLVDLLKVTPAATDPAARLAALEQPGRAWAEKKITELSKIIGEQIETEVAETKDEDAKQRTRDKLTKQAARWRDLMRYAHPGARINLVLPEGDAEGIVINVDRAGKAKQTAALGAWRVTIAVASPERQFDFSMASLFMPGDVKGEDERGFVTSRGNTSHTDLVASFEASRKEGRENRFVVTGNILKGYEQVGSWGQVVNFTDENGDVRSGVLTKRGFDPVKFMAQRKIRFPGGATVAAFVEKVSDVTVKGTEANIVAGRNRRGFYVQMDRTGRAAKKYYTDRSVRAAVAPTEFESRGNKMMAEGLSRDQFVNAIDAMKKIGAAFETDTAQDEAQAIIAESQSDGENRMRAIGGYKTEPRKGDRLAHIVMRRLKDRDGKSFLARVVENDDDITVEMYDDRDTSIPEDRISKGVSRLGRKLGYVDLNYMGVGRFATHGHRGPLYEVGMVEVEEDQRMRGLAKAVYNMIEDMLGTQMMPSGTLLPPGYEHWKRRNPDLVRGHQFHRDDEMYYSPKKIKEDLDNLERRIENYRVKAEADRFANYQEIDAKRVATRYGSTLGLPFDLFDTGTKDEIATALAASPNLLDVVENYNLREAIKRGEIQESAAVIADGFIVRRTVDREEALRCAEEQKRSLENDRAVYRGMWRKVPKDLRSERAREAMFSAVDDLVRPQFSLLDRIELAVSMRRSVDLTKEAAPFLADLRSKPLSMLPSAIPEAVITRLDPMKTVKDSYLVTATTADGVEHRYVDRIDIMLQSQGLFDIINGQPLVILSPFDPSGDGVKMIGRVRAHEGVHALRTVGFLPGSPLDRDRAWGRLVGHADKLRVLHMSRSELYARLNDARALIASKTVTTYEVYHEIYKNTRNAREKFDQEAVAHMVEIYVAGGWTAQEIGPIKDVLDDLLSGKIAQTDRGDALTVDMLRSYSDAQIGQSMRRDLDSLGYYSKALEAAKSLKQAKGTPEQMLAQLKSAGVKDAEIEATKLGEFLKSKSGSTTALESNAITLPPKPGHLVAYHGSPHDIDAFEVPSFFHRQESHANEYRRAGGMRGSLGGVSSFKPTEGYSLAAEAIDDNGGNTLHAVSALKREQSLAATAPARRNALQFAIDHIESGKSTGAIYEVEIQEPTKTFGPSDYNFLDQARLDGHKVVETFDGEIIVLDKSAVNIRRKYGSPQPQGDRTASPPRRALLKQITKSEIIKHLEENRVQVKEVVLVTDRALAAERGKEYDRMPPDARDMLAMNGRIVKWRNHSLDSSNPTYRETVLHLPSTLKRHDRETYRKLDRLQRQMEDANARLDYDAADSIMAEIEAIDPRYLELKSQHAEDFAPQDFQSGHFPEPNIIGHMMTSMTTHQGKPVFTLDQIQSDWGQKLRDGGVRDDEKIAGLKAKLSALGGYDKVTDDLAAYYDAMAAKYGINAGSRTTAVEEAALDQLKTKQSEASRLQAELNTAEASSPGNPLVNTTDQWVNTVLRRAVRQAAEAGADYIAIPTGATVESYNPQGDSEGNAVFYEKIVPKNLRNLLQRIDKAAPAPERIETLDSPSGKTGLGKGFALFKLTDAVKDSVIEQGQSLFSSIPSAKPSDGLTAAARAKKGDLARDMAEAVNIVNRMTGLGAVDVRFKSDISTEGMRKSDLDAVLSVGLSPVPLGKYTNRMLDAKPLIELATWQKDQILTQAGHEAYHHVETVLASPQELKLLRSPMDMARARIHAAIEIGRSAEDVAKLPDYEIRAIAFQRYRRLREEGAHMSPLHIGVRRLWDRMIRVFQNVRNALRGQGFDSMESIFERARTGEMVVSAAERRIDATATPAPRVGFERQMVPQGYVAREPFDLDKVREARRYTADVALADVRTVQSSVGIASTKAKLRNSASDGPVSVFKWGGLYYINDGNHRIEAAHAKGVATIRAEVIELAPRGTDGTDVLASRGQADFPAQRVGAQEADTGAEALASFFPTATSSGTYLGRKVAATMRRMAPLSDAWRVRVQDKFLPMRRQQEAIEGQTGASTPLPLDVYVAEALYHGRAGERAADLQQKHVEPLVEFLRKNEITGDQLGEYLYAHHAIERNAYIRSIDPANDAGSGMTDRYAADFLRLVSTGPKHHAYVDAAKMVDAINVMTRDTLLSSGLISREVYDAWSTDYQHYVPLRGFEIGNDENPEFPRVGKGFNVRGPEALRALGRRSVADNPVAYVLLQAQQAIVRSEKNRVNKTLLRLVQAHPDPDVWQVYKGEYKRVLKTDPVTGQEYVDTVFVPPQFSRDDPSIVGVKVGGKQQYIQIHNPNLARALRGVGSSDLDHAIVRNMMAVTRFYAQLLTSWNPEFVVGNFFRDVQAAILNSKDVTDLPAGARKKLLAEALSLKSIRSIYNALRGDGTSEYAPYFDEFRLAGGKISFLEYNDVERIKKRITDAMTEGKTLRALRQAGKYVEDVNTSVENGVRLSTYIAMRKAGIPKDRAAYVARELTVNFNRKGEWGPVINSAYMFFNASVQGSTRILQAIAKSKAVRRAVYGIVAGGFAMEMLNYLIAGDDKDKENAYDKIKPWIKERNMIFMLPGRTDYIQIPMPYGYNVPFVAGQKLAEAARTAAGHGKLTPAKAASGIMSAMMGSFNPLGTDPSVSFLQMMSPTLLDPVVQVAENKTWYGGPIFPTKYDRNKPDSENYFNSVHPAFIAVAKTLNSATGGNAARSGVIDVSPEVLEHYAQFVGGGIGKFVLNATGSGQRALSGEEFVPEKTPIIRRLYGKQTTDSRRRDFFEAWTQVDAAHYEVIQLNKAKDRDGMNAARKEWAPELEAYGAMKGAQKNLSEYGKLRAQVQLNKEMSDADKKAKLDDIKDRENALILRVLEVYTRAKKAHGVNR